MNLAEANESKYRRVVRAHPSQAKNRTTGLSIRAGHRF
jgi:hypothetical protein